MEEIIIALKTLRHLASDSGKRGRQEAQQAFEYAADILEEAIDKEGREKVGSRNTAGARN